MYQKHSIAVKWYVQLVRNITVLTLINLLLFPDHPEVLLPAMLEEFPFLHVSPQTAHSMWNKQARHLSSVLKSGAEAKKTKTQRMIEDAEKRQEALVGILKKDLGHNLRMVRL